MTSEEQPVTQPEPKRRRWLRFAAGSVWTVAAAEFFLRWFAPVPMLPRYVVATEFGIRGNKPNSTYKHRTPEYTVEIRTNAQSMRADHDVSLEAQPGVKRVLLLGDSFGMGYGVDLEDTFTEHIRRHLEASGIRCEIVNLAVSGHGNAEQLVMLRQHGLKYSPDLVIVAWHASDAEDNVRSNLFRLEGDRIVATGAEYLPGVKLREFLFGFAAYRWLASSSHLYTSVREAAAVEVKTFLATLHSKSPSTTAHRSPRDGERPYGERLMMALLSELAKTSRKAGAEFLLLDIPVRRDRSVFVSALPPKPDGWQKALNVVSPIEGFRAHEGELLFWEKSHGHLTPLGTRETGVAVARQILAAGLLHD